MRRFWLPLLSGLLFALSLYPFHVWPFALAALAPLFYFAWRENGRYGRFFGGFIMGAIAVAPTLWFSLAHLEPQLGAPALTLAVRLSSPVFLLFIGSLFGLLALLIGELRSESAVRDIFAAAALYTGVELLLFAVFSGYYYASLAHALAPFALARLVVAWGGVPLLVFTVAWLCAAAVRSRRAFCAGVLLVCACAGVEWGLQHASPVTGTLSVSVIQRQPQELYDRLVPPSTPFEDPSLEPVLVGAASTSQLVVYPFSPVQAAYRGQKPDESLLPGAVADTALGAWVTGSVPSSTVMLWNTTAQDGAIYDEFDFWNSAGLQTYQKTILYPLSDYAPSWLSALGFAHDPFQISPGTNTLVSVEGAQIGGLICSELQQESYARGQAARSDILLSVGYDGFFPGTLASNWSLAAARLRAAENGTPLIRGYIFGPSALIASDGSVIEEAPEGSSAVIRGVVPIQKVPTLFSVAGSMPAYALIVLSLSYALYRRYIS